MLNTLTDWLRGSPRAADDDSQDDEPKGWGLSLWSGALIVALFTIAISWCHTPPPPDIVTLIEERSDLTIFRSMIASAGIEEELNDDDDEFTFFAPNDAAFDVLPARILEQLQSRPDLAIQFLRFHATSGTQSLGALQDVGFAALLAGQNVPVADTNGTVRVANVGVVESDVEALNGVIHIVDSLIGFDPASLPMPGEGGFLDVLDTRPDLATLAAAIRSAGPGTIPASTDGYTLFAPSNDAFGKLPAGSVDVLVATQPRLLELLGYHIVPGRFLASDLSDGMTLTTLSGAQLPVAVSGDTITVGGATLTESDLDSADGVVHIIESVAIPPDFRLPTINEALALESITFETGSAIITPEGAAVLDRAATFLAANPAIRVAIEGHTDSEGDEATNLTLSVERAEAVRDYLVEQGIASDRLETEGFGETQPIASNDTEEGRAQNRRIEFRLL